MLKAKLDQMVKGWFVGNFNPTVLRTTDFEAAVKHYKAGDREDWHYHKIATEITVIVVGDVRMNGVDYTAGDIITMEPGDGTDFEAITDAITTVVKAPSVVGDKYTRGN
jgi:quercetin dioxygenase-like cupin family protein